MVPSQKQMTDAVKWGEKIPLGPAVALAVKSAEIVFKASKGLKNIKTCVHHDDDIIDAVMHAMNS